MLVLAPGGMRSAYRLWDNAPGNPGRALAGTRRPAAQPAARDAVARFLAAH